MTVFIAHAETDQAVAEQLQRFLERRGLFVERESGQMARRPLQHGDTLVALWSKDSVFSPFRLQFEKRALDAWADGRLIFVKLDHHFAPVGLRDLPAIDATFEQQRELVAWAEIAKRAQEVRRGPPPESASEGAREEDAMLGGAPPPAGAAPAPQAPSPARKRAKAPPVGMQRSAKSGGPWAIVFALVIVVAAAAGGFFLAPRLGLDPVAQAIGLDLEFVPLVVAALAALLVALIVGLVSALARPKPRTGQLDTRSAEETDFEAPSAELGSPAVFVSYARADASKVIPVCDALKKDGNELWIDQQGIGAGDSWAGEIVRAIRTVRGVAVMCSKAAFESDHVKREVYLADRYKKRLLPVFIEETPMPDDFEYFFAGVQQLKLHEAPEAERAALMARALAAV